MRLIKTDCHGFPCPGGDWWRGESMSDAAMLEHLSGGCIAVSDDKDLIAKLRHLALLHEWRLLLPGESFE